MFGLRHSLWLVALLIASLACNKSEPVAIATASLGATAKIEAAPKKDLPVWFRFDDVTTQWQIDFSQVSGNSPEKHFPAANGSGVVIFDADNNNDMDLYFLTARHMPFEPGSDGPRNKLFLNLGGGRPFLDVSKQAKVDLSQFCHGVVHGDLDNDGFSDLVLTAYGGSSILMNQGDGTFQRLEGFHDDRWGSSVAVGDFDSDGNLDIYATHYGIWSIETNQRCGDQEKQVRTFCNPRRIPPTLHAMYHNNGDRSFVDATLEANLTHDDGRGQGVVTADVDMDGDIDIYVANDLCPNFLYLNEGDGRFIDQTDFSGASLSREGLSQAGMGVDCADIDRDGFPDLFVTNFNREYNSLYLNLDRGGFLDRSHANGVAGDSMEEVGWGTRMVDLDNDGWLDIFVTNGHVDDNIALVSPTVTYAQAAKLWHNEKGTLKFQQTPAGSYFETGHVGRGAAFGDLDNDGRLDIAVNHVDSKASVLRNTTEPPKDFPTPWLRFTVVGRLSNRDAVGTAVQLTGPDIPKIIEQRTSGGSYLSGHDPRILIGIGPTPVVPQATVRFPAGTQARFENLQPGCELLVVEAITP